MGCALKNLVFGGGGGGVEQVIMYMCIWVVVNLVFSVVVLHFCIILLHFSLQEVFLCRMEDVQTFLFLITPPVPVQVVLSL